MKTLSSVYHAHVQGETLSLAICWRITKRNGEIIRGTEHDEDITITTPANVAGTYKASASVNGSDIRSTSDLAVDNLDVEGTIDTDLDIGVSIADIEAGLYDDAEVIVFIANWQNPDGGVDIKRRGYLGNIQRDSDYKFKTEIRGMLQKFSQTLGYTYGEECNVEEFGSARCGVNIADYTYAAAVTSVTDRKRFVIFFGSPVPPTFPRVVPTQGAKITFNTGASSGTSKEVKTFSVSGELITIELYEELYEDLSIGDAVTFRLGCNKLYSTCKRVYDNLENFKGWGVFIPGSLAIMRGPALTECTVALPTDDEGTIVDGEIEEPSTPDGGNQEEPQTEEPNEPLPDPPPSPSGGSLIYLLNWEGGPSDVGSKATLSVAGGTIEIQQNIVRAGRYAQKATLHWDPDGSNYRAETVPRSRDPVRGELTWYGFSIYLPDPYPTDNFAWEIVAQFHHIPSTGWANAPPGNPPMTLTTIGGRWGFRTAWDTVDDFKPYEGNIKVDLGAYAVGQWTDWVWGIAWDYTSSGKTYVYKNGQLVYSRLGPNIYVAPRMPYFKWGIYKGWKKGNKIQPGVTSRVLYHDEFRMGTTREQVTLP